MLSLLILPVAVPVVLYCTALLTATFEKLFSLNFQQKKVPSHLLNQKKKYENLAILHKNYIKPNVVETVSLKKSNRPI